MGQLRERAREANELFRNRARVFPAHELGQKELGLVAPQTQKSVVTQAASARHRRHEGATRAHELVRVTRSFGAPVRTQFLAERT